MEVLHYLALSVKVRGGYNSVNLGKKHGYKSGKRDLTSMTVAQVKAMQDSKEINAAGKFQIIRDTMPDVIKGMKLTGNEKFDEKMQERMGAWLAFNKRTELGNFIKGKHNNINKAGDQAAQEWASLPMFTGARRGKSAYSDGVNKAHHSVDATTSVLLKARENYAAAIKRGMSEQDAQLAAFSGMGVFTTGKTSNQKVPSTLKRPDSNTATISPITRDAESIIQKAKPQASILSTQPAVTPVALRPNSLAASYTPPKLETKIEPAKEYLTSPDPQKVHVVNSNSGNISQNVSNRILAHAITGGLGMGDKWNG